MRSMISPDYATARRGPHDPLTARRSDQRSACQGRVQASSVPQMPREVPQCVGRRADLFALQEHEYMAERHASQVLHHQRPPVTAPPGTRLCPSREL